MEFESPDVEKDFPGLYASESGKRSNESDFSDEAHERISKKDLLIGKRKDKKDSKKDRGYATLEGESSPEEDSTDIRSPSKAKKSKPFKFPSKKEKREKSREKDGKEKEVEKEKEKEKRKDTDKDKEKKKESKVKLKLKERKKLKHGEESLDIGEEQPIFGVSLALALERNRCHDGVEIPLVIRDCVSHIQEGLCTEGLYKNSGIKSKVQHVRRLYNQREPVCLADYDLPVSTSLLKLFLRDLPEPILTSKLLGRFEEAGSLKDVAARGAELKSLVQKLPSCNRVLLAWIVKHLDEVVAHEKQNKMSVQTLSLTLSQPLQMSQKLVAALLYHCDTVFSGTKLTKYVPPLTSSSPALPETADAIAEELRKQESLLGQIHREMNAGFVTKQREELLWEVQRMITQLKRKLRSLEKAVESNQRSVSDEVDSGSGGLPSNGAKAAPAEEDPPLNLTLRQQNSPAPAAPEPSAEAPAATPPTVVKHVVEAVIETVDSSNSAQETQDRDSSSDHQTSTSAEELALCLETEELLALVGQLQAQIAQEKSEAACLRAQIRGLGGSPGYCDYLLENCSKEMAAICPENPEAEDGVLLKQVVAESQVLQLQRRNLTQTIIEEQAECLDLRVQLKLLQMAGGV